MRSAVVVAIACQHRGFMARQKRFAIIVATALALSSTAVLGFGIPAGLKSKKLAGDLVPAYRSVAKGSGIGDDDGDNPPLNDAAEPRTNCTFLKGAYKFQTGKDGQIKMSGVSCGGVPLTGQLCAHAKGLSTIVSEDLDKTGAPTTNQCTTTAGDIAGKINWVTVNIGLLTCNGGTCLGTLPAVTTDPCPGVDKVTEYRRIEVFSGSDKLSAAVLGTTLAACCGPTQTLAGSISVGSSSPCNVSTQDVMAIGGTVLQGVAP